MTESAPTRENQQKRRPRPWAPGLWCIAAAALFGASTPASKLVLGSIGPFTLAGLLYVGAALAVAPFAFRGGSREARRRPRTTLRLVGMIFFGGVLGPALLMLGLSRAPAATVSLWLNLETPATAVIAWLFFREHLGARGLVAVALVTTASALLAGASGMALVPAALLVAGACVAWGIDNNLSSLIDGYTPAQSTLLKGLAAGTTNLVIGLVVEQQPTALDAITIGKALAIGALAYGASIVLYVSGAQQLGAVRSQMLFSTAPFFGVAIAWVVLREPLSLTQVAAAVLIVGALALVHRERHGHGHTHERVTHTHGHRHDDEHHDHLHEDGADGVGWHVHEHTHEPVTHEHAHRPDLHHRHEH